MAIKIGHASLSEKGTVNGNAGDSTGKEVCTRTWYNKPWGLVLRAKSSAIAEKQARACEAGCANNRIGYSQATRNTAHTQAKKVGYDLSKIATNCNTDCSAFMTLCALAAGVTGLEYTSNAPTTSTMKTKFIATGQYDVLTDNKYLTSDAYLKRGDILVAPGKHTVMALENGSKAITAPAPQAPVSVPATSSSFNSHLKDLQWAITQDRTATLTADGLYGSKTDAALKKVVVKNGSKGNVVSWVQCRVGAGIDANCGANTVAKIKEYQRAHGLTADGIAGYNTIKTILRSYGVNC